MISWVLWQAYRLHYSFVCGICGLDCLHVFAYNVVGTGIAVARALYGATLSATTYETLAVAKKIQFFDGKNSVFSTKVNSVEISSLFRK